MVSTKFRCIRLFRCISSFIFFLFIFVQQASAIPLGQESCEALLEEGSRLEQQAEYSQALERSQEAQACYKEKTDRAGEAQSTSQMGRIYEALGEYEQAIELGQQALAIQQEIGDRKGQATTLGLLGLVYFNQGLLQKALESLPEDELDKYYRERRRPRRAGKSL